MLTIGQTADAIKLGKLSPVELTSACLRAIDELDPELHAFITVTGASALEEACRAEHEIAAGKSLGPLHGIPIALKDLLDTPGVRTTAASRVFKDRIPDVEAEVVRRLRAAGAVIIGKTNLHEFAYGCSSVITAFGIVRNPNDPERVAGGSSSGSAVAVATGMCVAAIGTDTAGSIRLPAAYCGVVGFKPTYGSVSCNGVIPLSHSYDTVGPITRTARDAALIFRAIHDETSQPSEPPRDKVRIGVAREYFFTDLDPEISSVIEHAIKQIEESFGPALNVRIDVDEDRTIHKAEAFAFHLPFLEQHAAEYQPETLRRILSGRDVKPADYAQACLRLRTMRAGARRIFEHVDIVITPTCSLQPPTIKELQSEAQSLRSREIVMLRNTRPFSVLGLPTISVPCGVTSAGLPVGIQLTAAHGKDMFLLEFAEEFEQLISTSQS